MATYGKLEYESTESRALKSITADGYNKDQAKNLIQLNNNTAYMAQYLRKLQRGVDEANANIIEQAQGFINDLLVLVGGGSATGLDFGDMKYVFQSWGALFGFTDENGNVQLPINLFQAAWHFFSTYVLGAGGQFGGVIDSMIDGFLAVLVSQLGDVPIIGHAVGQIANFISDTRDFVDLLHDKFFAFLNNVTDGIGEGIDYIEHILAKIYDRFIQPIIDLISKAIGGPVGKAIGWIQDVVSKIFSLANGADTKASLVLKKATPLWETLDGNGETSTPLATADVSMTVNATNARGSIIKCRGGDKKQTISCIAQKSGTVNTFFLDVYEMGLDSSATKIYTSPDLAGDLSSVAQAVLFHEMSDDDAFTTSLDGNYIVVARMTGSGSVTLQGKAFTVAVTSVRPLYPAILRNPSVIASPTSFTTSDLDAIYVKEIPYFQLGTLADIVPQSFYNDFTTFSDNLWIKKRNRDNPLGEINYQSSIDGMLDIKSNGNPGWSWCIHKFSVTSNRCRIGIKIGQAASRSATTVTMFSRLDKANGIGLKVWRDTSGSFDMIKVDLVKMNGYNSETFITTILNSPQNTSNNNYVGDWIYLEYDPSDTHYRVYLNPDFSDPNNRLIPALGGYVVAEFDETTYGLEVGGINEILKTTSARSSSIIQRTSPSTGSPAGLDDWKLEDYPDPNA